MEQRQDQARERQTAQKQDQRTAEHRREPERERLGNAGLTARAVSAGRSLLDLPPEGLEELAAWMGNQGMEELLAAQGPPLEETAFALPGGGAVAISTAEYFTGGGTSLIGTGLTLDREVPLTGEGDAQLEAALELLAERLDNGDG